MKCTLLVMIIICGFLIIIKPYYYVESLSFYVLMNESQLALFQTEIGLNGLDGVTFWGVLDTASMIDYTPPPPSSVENTCWIDGGCPGGVGGYCLCIPGFFMGGYGGCESCYPGSFKASYGFEACSPCSEGTYASGFGSTACQYCEEGTYSILSACENCSNGVLEHASGMIGCLAIGCEAGYVLNWDHTACVDCPLNWTIISDGGCVPEAFHECPDGFVPNWDESACVACPENWTFTSSGGCVSPECPSPMVLAAYGGDCVPCQSGWYRTGPSTCQTCQAGKYSDMGSTSCYDCVAGKISIGGGKECTACPPGSYYAPMSGMSACLLCNGIVFVSFSSHISQQNYTYNTLCDAGWHCLLDARLSFRLFLLTFRKSMYPMHSMSGYYIYCTGMHCYL